MKRIVPDITDTTDVGIVSVEMIILSIIRGIKGYF